MLVPTQKIRKRSACKTRLKKTLPISIQKQPDFGAKKLICVIIMKYTILPFPLKPDHLYHLDGPLMDFT